MNHEPPEDPSHAFDFADAVSAAAAADGDAPESPATIESATHTARRGANKPKTRSDPRVPRTGTAIKRQYKGKTIVVTVTRDGFVCRRKTYRSLSGLATKLTGHATNGFVFFGLIAKAKGTKARRAKPAKPTRKTTVKTPKKTASSTKLTSTPKASKKTKSVAKRTRS